jgi:hypothetical protein
MLFLSRFYVKSKIFFFFLFFFKGRFVILPVKKMILEDMKIIGTRLELSGIRTCVANGGDVTAFLD